MDIRSTLGMESSWRFGVAVIAVVAICGSLGCGSATDGPERYTVTGSVVYDDQPVPFGEIIFEPDASAGNSGPQGYAQIVNGKYETDPDRGMVGGPHKVVISGYPVDPANEDEENPSTPLFQGYGTTVDLPEESGTQDFEVPAS